MIDLNKMSVQEAKDIFVKNNDLRLDVVTNMKKYGGSFVVALSECIILADINNLRKIADTFIAYIIEYQPSRWPKKDDL